MELDLQRIYEELSKPLPPEAVERTFGEMTGKGYDTVGYGYQWAVNRFNEVLGLSGWTYSYSFLEVEQVEGLWAVTAEVEITIGRFEGGQFVPYAAPRKAVGGHVARLLADARKGAITNAFKKCAAFWGVGKQAYEGTLDDDSRDIWGNPGGYKDGQGGPPKEGSAPSIPTNTAATQAQPGDRKIPLDESGKEPVRVVIVGPPISQKAGRLPLVLARARRQEDSAALILEAKANLAERLAAASVGEVMDVSGIWTEKNGELVLQVRRYHGKAL